MEQLLMQNLSFSFEVDEDLELQTLETLAKCVKSHTSHTLSAKEQARAGPAVFSLACDIAHRSCEELSCGIIIS